MIFEINGVQYTEIERPQRNGATLSAYMLSMLMVAGAMHGLRNKQKEMPPYNLIKEFELIQKKQSKLSRSEREHVVRQFKRTFKQVEP